MYGIKQFLYACLAIIIGMSCCALMKVLYFIRLYDIQGERIYFLGSSSSQALQKSSLSFLDITSVKGECVYTTTDAYTRGRCLSKEEIAREIVDKYAAEILFMEEVDGVSSYYAYTDAWADGVYIYGKKVNLHVAVGAKTLSVGSPIIFGGY